MLCFCFVLFLFVCLFVFFMKTRVLFIECSTYNLIYRICLVAFLSQLAYVLMPTPVLLFIPLIARGAYRNAGAMDGIMAFFYPDINKALTLEVSICKDKHVYFSKIHQGFVALITTCNCIEEQNTDTGVIPLDANPIVFFRQIYFLWCPLINIEVNR